MRKRRRLANKLTIMVCAVLVAVSAFFYAPMEVCAEESLNLSEKILVNNLSIASDDILKDFNMTSSASPVYYGVYSADFGVLDFAQYFNGVIDSESLYRVEYDLSLKCDGVTANVGDAALTSMVLKPSDITDFIYSDVIFASSNTAWGGVIDYSSHNVKYFTASQLSRNYDFLGYYFGPYASSISFNIDIGFSNISVTKVSSSDTEDYQNGYNAGYSVGESAGYGNGYSQGFADGEASVDTGGIYDEAFQAGKDSVDTQSFYDAGYQAGYDAAYSEGYESGYDEGLKSARESKGEWGKYIYLKPMQNVTRVGNPFYVSSYALLDMEEYQSGANGYFRNTVPGTYQGETTISYHIPLYTLNNNSPLKIDSDSLNVRFEVLGIRPVLDCNLGGATVRANLFNSKIQEIYVLYNGQKYYGNYDSGTSYADFNFMISGLSGDTLLSDWDMTLCFELQNTVTLVTDEDVSRFVSAEYTPNISFELGRETSNNAVTLRPYYSNDRVSANIKNQTDEIKGSLDSGFNVLTNGFDSSSGDSVNSDLSTGLNEYQTAEDSLWATATTGLKDFTFFDFESVPAMITGMSFITSIMGKWFNEAGGASGVGIVLSILFSVMLVSMVLGLYRLYQSAGHRAEARRRHSERMQHWKKGK